jgi:hypothetical protein
MRAAVLLSDQRQALLTDLRQRCGRESLVLIHFHLSLDFYFLFSLKI